MGNWLSDCLKGVLPSQYDDIDAFDKEFPLDSPSGKGGGEGGNASKKSDYQGECQPLLPPLGSGNTGRSSTAGGATESIEIPSTNSRAAQGKGDRDGSSASSSTKFQQPKAGFFIEYELKDVIGYGSTSTCHRCVRKSDKLEFACKVIDKRQVEAKFSGLLDQFYVEIKVLQTLKHPHIIHLEGVYETPDRIYMVMELMQGGEIFDYVVDKGTLSEEEASVLVRKLTSAVAHMHDLNVIHRDLKPENLLLTARSGKNNQVKIIDFGLSKIVNDTTPASSFLGTRGYLAPEMLQRHSYDKAVDIWALGVIVFVLLCGCLPFDDDSSRINTDDDARKKFTLRFPRWAMNLSAPAKDLLQSLLDVNPKTRFTAQQALTHPWVAGRSVAANNYLTSPSMIGERRKELRSPMTPSMQAMKTRIMNQSTAGTAGAGAASKSPTSGRPRKNSF